MRKFLTKLISVFLFANCVNAEPPREIPDDLIDGYTLNGKIPIRQSYWDSTYTTPVFYSKNQISDFIQKVGNGENGYYGETDFHLYMAIRDNIDQFRGKIVAIMGSTIPWYESIVIYFGGIPVTIEYNQIETDDPRLNILTVDEHNANPKQYDAILSISSYEHDGLGRYGDPLDPNGDLRAMRESWECLKPGGLLFLAVPIGRDELIWNANRVYGRLRLPMLLERWKLEKSYGFIESDLDTNERIGCYQPVFVLRKQ